MVKEIEYSLASSAWDEKEVQAMERVIQSNHFTMGENVAEFERMFADKFGSRFAVMVNSGSSANLLAIAALCYKKENPLKAGDEVIVPSLSWSTTYYPVHQYGMKLVFVDIDLNSLNLDCFLLELALSENTKAILVPNILGNPAQLEFLRHFAKEHDLYLIEDNCESMGAKIGDKFTGTFGICGTFSTFFSHHISTMEGGVVVTDDEEVYHLLLALRAHGWTRQLPNDNKICEKKSDPFYESYRFILPGYNVRPLELEGAIGIEQLKKLDHLLEVRRENAVYFQSLFMDDSRFILQKEHGLSSWFGFSMIIHPDADLERPIILNALTKANIEVRPIVSGNILQNDVIHHLNHRIVGDHKNAQYVHEYGFFIGNHHFNLCEALDYLKDVLNLV